MKGMLFSVYIILFSALYSYAQQEYSVKKIPTAKTVRVPKIDIKHIVIDLKFNWDKKQAIGSTSIVLSPLFETRNIYLDAGMLSISSIHLSNETLLQYTYDGSDKNDALNITLDRTYKPNEDIKLMIEYHTNWINEIDPNYLSGTNGKGLRFSTPTFNDPIKPQEIWSIGEPESNRYWFPSYDAPNDLRTTELLATVDKELQVISNGDLIECIKNNDNTKTYHWKSEIPYANHLTSIVVGDFFDVQENYENFMIHNYGAEKEMDWVAASVIRLSDMMAYFSKSTGTKYPFPRYSQAFVQDIGSYTSNQGLATITENMIDDQSTHADYFYLWDLTESEALAQQWFGNYMTTEDWSDIWLNKSMAHYFSQLYNKQKNGKAEYLLYQHSFDQGIYLADWNSGYKHPIVTQHYDDVTSFTTDNYASIRGALVLNMLHKHLGDEKWWKTIKLYTQTYAGKLVNTSKFLNAVEEACGEQLDWFFEQWIYNMGHPIFVVTKQYDAIHKELSITVKQTQTKDVNNEFPQTSYFKGNIEIEIDGKIEKVWLDAKAENQFTFKLANPPKLINFDYESTWIKEIQFEKTIDELMYQFKNSKDIIAKQTALNELTSIALNESTSKVITEKIKKEFRFVISGNSYWRFRNNVMGQLRKIINAPNNPIDQETEIMLLNVIKKDSSWIKASAIGLLGSSNQTKYTNIYIKHLNDKSDRVINAAAIALGKTKDAKAFDALKKLTTKPSMKSQSLISALSGLKILGDQRAYEIAYNALADLKLSRWRLPDYSVWDYRIFAAQTITSLGRAKDVYPMIEERLMISLKENDINGIFNNILIINILAEPKAQKVYDLLKNHFKENTILKSAIEQYEIQFKEAITIKK